MKKHLSVPAFVMLALLAALTSCKSTKIVSLTASETARLYSLPPSVLIPKGTILHTTTGDVVLNSDQRLYSEAAYNEQVERAIRSTP